ncbi:hypothetical protein R3P38DRAFT_2935271 [Favolaschia claudopus]|uniref:Golgi apparatus membrane protein TVP38 n=1 Tax=Favolaschia claudopus TaxID=2862362 RepID=A0AAW0BNZ9_9AGAR
MILDERSGSLAHPQPVLAAPAPAYAYEMNPPSASGTNAQQSSNRDSISRDISRTPSPTPSENDLLNGVRKKVSWKNRIRLYLTLAVLVAIVVLIEAFHDDIIKALRPATDWLHATTGGWLIPIVVLMALSFPPLFGHEIVVILCGAVWGLGEGFGIVAAGTILGETCTYFVFQYCCGVRGKNWEMKNMAYGTLAHVIRDGGLLIAIVVRFSALPAHFTTAVFATCGMPLWVFLLATVVALPKQLALVYIGKAFESGDKTSDTVLG